MNDKNDKLITLVNQGIEEAETLLECLKEIKTVVTTTETPTPPLPTPPGREFAGGHFKTYGLRGDGGGLDKWIEGFSAVYLSGTLQIILPEGIYGPLSGAQHYAARCWLATPQLKWLQDLNYDPTSPTSRLWKSTKKIEVPVPYAVVAEGIDGNRLIWSVVNSGTNSVVVWFKDQDPKIPIPPVPEPDGQDPLWVLFAPRLWIWREGSKANDFGVKESIVVATHGKAGAATVRLICMNGDPIVDVESMAQRTLAANTEGCAAVCIDLESHFIRKGKDHAQEVYEAITPILPLYWAPKAYNDHIERHWGLNFQEAAAWLDTYGDGQIPWIYSKAEAKDWLGLHKLTRTAGNTSPYIPLGDFAARSDHTPFLPQAVKDFYNAGLSTGVFMPDTNRYSTKICSTDTWKTALDVYG